ncbi:hypothetical protein [Streptomyces barringtoniae]|uniref:hypothetical protein n=1 Tax=Streptomyces barringtoniae TaxID=2892029 RepID=UPI001E2987A4|nr:hypothetical protein [Streptomyces barringtoniae]MCC5476481.1 hypothetical protein [Streptomyces barringtoniae]
METTPPLPATGGPRPDIHAEQDSSNAHAHRLRLYGALDKVCVPLAAADVQAVFQLAELDCVTVHAVIDWLNTARTLPPLPRPK